MTWQLQEAKNKFSEVVETSITKGPQIISRRGKDTAVLISLADYQRLSGKKKDLKKALMNSGFDKLDLENIRDRSTTGRATETNFDDL
jgi:antitoxin Phd